MFHVSRDTARRDIIKLVEAGLAIRTHGGIASPDVKKKIKAYKERLSTASKEKKLIGKKASAYIAEGDLCFLDVSTTIKSLCEHVNVPAVIFTHSLDNAEILSTKENIELHLLGGVFHQKNRFFHSPAMIAQLKEIYFDKAFFGAAGILSDGIYFEDQEDAFIKKTVAERSKQIILVTDGQKFNHPSRYKAMSLSDLDIFITDRKPPEIFIRLFTENDVKIEFIAEENEQTLEDKK